MTYRKREIQTYALLLRDLVDGKCTAFVLFGQGLVDGLSLSTFFAGWCEGRGEFPGGIYLLVTSLNRLKNRFISVCGKKEGLNKLIIVDDRKFPNDYSLNVSELLGNRKDVSLIVITRDKMSIEGDYARIDLSDTGAEIMDLFTLLPRADSAERN